MIVTPFALCEEFVQALKGKYEGLAARRKYQIGPIQKTFSENVKQEQEKLDSRNKETQKNQGVPVSKLPENVVDSFKLETNKKPKADKLSKRELMTALAGDALSENEITVFLKTHEEKSLGELQVSLDKYLMEKNK